MAKRALITGITGQDGSYLAELLLSEGYEVIGLIRRSSTVTIERISHIQDQLTLVSGDLLDEVSLINVLRDHRPSEVYNLAAQSFVQTSWTQPVLTGEITRARRHAHARRDPHRRPGDPLLPGELVRDVRQGAHGAPERGRRRSTRAAPTASPRSTATGSPSTTARATACTPRRDPVQPRVAATWARVRDAQGHPRRGAHQGRARHRAAPRQPRRASRLGLRGGLRARDVADAPARRRPTTSSSRPGETHSVRELCEVAFNAAGLNYEDHVVVDPKFIRPAEVDLLVGDATKAHEQSGLEVRGRLLRPDRDDGGRGHRRPAPGSSRVDARGVPRSGCAAPSRWPVGSRS